MLPVLLQVLQQNRSSFLYTPHLLPRNFSELGNNQKLEIEGQCIPAGSSVSPPRRVLITLSIITMLSISRKLCVRFFTLCKISTWILRIFWRHLQMDLRNV